jgi:hypothetical protein
MNPLQRTVGGAAPTSANLKWAAGIADWYTCFATIGVSSGKYYWEVTNTNLTSSSTYTTIGISKAVTVNEAGTNIGSDANSYVYYSQNGNKLNNGTQVAYGAAYVSNDIVGVALDLDNGKLFFSKNGTWQASGDPAAGTNAAYTGLSGTFQPAISELNSTIDINFGQRPFTYTPPTGFVRLNAFNLPDSTIKKGSSYMDAILYTGNGTNGRAITTGMATDFVWVKKRSASDNHELDDKVRGAAKRLSSNSTSAETAISAIASFTSTGFTVDGWGTTNENGYTYVAWSWLANGSGSTNTAGSITTTASVNTTAGFSIFTFTGTGASASVGHGLGVAPKFMVFKRRDSTSDWNVLTNAAGSNQYGFLNLTTAFASAGETWTSTVINIGANFVNGGTYVCYAWAEIAGFSKIGKYTGNGSADGPFAYLGFRPKFLLIYNTAGGDFWNLLDSSRDTYNASGLYLAPNTNGAEGDYRSTYPVDFLSNGFKVRNASFPNANGNTFIYMAFAENPFKNSNAR